MARDDWYRSADWDAASQELFRSKLSRARYHRPFYLAIKGTVLAAQTDAARRDAGRAMLGDVIANHRDYPSDAYSTARLGLARSYELAGAFTDAAELYEQLSDTGSRYSWVLVSAAEMHLKAKDVASAVHAIDRLEQDPDVLRTALTFNNGRFAYFVACARINTAQGSLNAAARCAKNALELASNREPQLRRNPTVGLVNAPAELLTELRSILESGVPEW